MRRPRTSTYPVTSATATLSTSLPRCNRRVRFFRAHSLLVIGGQRRRVYLPNRFAQPRGNARPYYRLDVFGRVAALCIAHGAGCRLQPAIEPPRISRGRKIEVVVPDHACHSVSARRRVGL